MGEVEQPLPPFLTRKLDFSDGSAYELLRPLTSLRSCHDGTPRESRIVFICRRIEPKLQDNQSQEFVAKIKVQ